MPAFLFVLYSCGMSKHIGILGGTFDPVHYGHLRPALDVLQQVGLDEIRFVPNNLPPHRQQPWLDADTRKRLVKLAIAEVPQFVLDERELQRAGPSFMVDTLRELRRDFPHDHLYLLMGADAFTGFTTWHEWQAILGLCHLIVMTRPGAELVSIQSQPDLIQSRIVHDARALVGSATGQILIQSVTALDISASHIRESLRQGRSIRFLLPEPIRAYLEGQHAT